MVLLQRFEPNGCRERLQSGISMMALFDDCIMTTCWVSLCCQC